ncbi:MAG: hypothetical protein FGM15_01505 [Chthoniobacterales bacterium]|nr:hypothetical protein [Chthoniobacterales bacterium]
MQFSSSWLWLAAGLYLLFEMWRGWRRGVVRHGISVTALAAAGGVGWIFASMTGFAADRLIPLPVPMGRALLGLAAGLAFYIAAVVLSSLLFKKTSQQSGIVRLIYGAGGSFFGLVFGLLVLWGGITMFRALGAVAEGQASVAGQFGAPPVPAAAQLTSAKQALEEGTTGSVVNAVDILPAEAYSIITGLVEVGASPDAAARLLAYPPVQQLLAQPKLAAFFADREIVEAASRGDYLALIGNPKLIQVVSDPEVQKSFTEFEWQKALDYALQKPAPSPVPSS